MQETDKLQEIDKMQEIDKLQETDKMHLQHPAACKDLHWHIWAPAGTGQGPLTWIAGEKGEGAVTEV